MQLWQEKLIEQYKKEKNNRQKLEERLHQPQGDISYEQWDKMHYQLHAMDKFVSVLYSRVKEFYPDV